jgi:hypothetical protein
MRVGGGLGEVVDDLVGSEVLIVEVGGMALPRQGDARCTEASLAILL